MLVFEGLDQNYSSVQLRVVVNGAMEVNLSNQFKMSTINEQINDSHMARLGHDIKKNYDIIHSLLLHI